MEKLITYETIRSFAYVNDSICPMSPKGIVLHFFGLNGRDMYHEETEQGQYFAERGILYVVPYNNPWAWMNRQAINYTDELLDVLIEHYHLPDDIPIASTGGSMGGMSALVYTRYAKRTPAVCVSNCPVCDVPYHYTERPDLPRTMYSAFYHESGKMKEILTRYSPLHLAASMPDIPYYLFHCTEDRSVNKEKHSDRFVAEMRRMGKRITYYEVPDKGHCKLGDEMFAVYYNHIADEILKK